MFTVGDARKIMRTAKKAKEAGLPETFVSELVNAAYNGSSQVAISAKNVDDMNDKCRQYREKGFAATGYIDVQNCWVIISL